MKKSAGKIKFRQSRKIGLAPGTPVFIGREQTFSAKIQAISYTPNSCKTIESASPEQCLELTEQSDSTVWINVKGIHDVELVAKIAKLFGLHPLTVESTVNTLLRPRVEIFNDYLFFVQKTVSIDDKPGLCVQQVSVVLGKNFVITFLEDSDNVFDNIKTRIVSAKGRIRTMKADYLAYSLMDSVLDKYYVTVENLGDLIEAIDEKLMINPASEDVKKIHNLKRSLMRLRKALWPLREEFASLEKSDFEFVDRESKIFFRDLYNNAVQLIDITENYRELLAGMHDTYLSYVSNRMNEIMKVLTVIATIFIPLTFIAGVYGMNFEYMPELQWREGYYIVLGIMLSIAIGMILFFKRKKWL